jgi:16S rRNA (cytidine1402-2'-O)-methyltransferase
MSAKGKLYVIPINISESDLSQVLPLFNDKIVKQLRVFVVEKIKTSRQFLRKMDRDFPIDDSVFYEQNKHDDYSFHRDVLVKLNEGNDVGLMSESGYPAIADPGSLIVSMAQSQGIKVIPLVGPSSILMALAASGMNGQGFTFNGYLPKKDPERSKEIKFITNLISKTGFAQIFIETPYRNEMIFSDFLKHCSDELKLCVAYDVTGVHEKIVTKSISSWKKSPFPFDKVPCVFVLGN